MPPGPILMFDKSTLQSLNSDEALWLDNFFISSITPLFFVEVLADLEKEMKAGRTPEQVVGNLASKTPDMESVPHVHHGSLLAMELSGQSAIDMRFGRPLVAGGNQVALEGQSGVIFKPSPEAEALQRWQRHEFLDVERLIAKDWRRALSNLDLEGTYQLFQPLFKHRGRPKDLAEVKAWVDSYIDHPDEETTLRMGVGMLGYLPDVADAVAARWRNNQRPPIREFAPYFIYMLSVVLVFYVGMAADLISRDRPSNMIDIAYLFYLPFCMVFASNDRLHARLAPLFLKPHQEFMEGAALKADLGRLDAHYAALPAEIRDRGVSTFAQYPPDDDTFLVTQTWNRYLPTWRAHQAAPSRPDDPDADKAILERTKRMAEAQPTAEASQQMRLEDADFVMIQRRVRPKRGKWLRFPPESLKGSPDER